MTIVRTHIFQAAVILLVGIVSAVTGYFFAFNARQTIVEPGAAPMVYVGRCGFQFEGKNCGDLARNVIFDSSDEFLSFTRNWAVGRLGEYKIYLSCFAPGDERYIDGTFSSLTVVVSGPDLLSAHEVASQLMVDFSEQLPEQGGGVAHCIEQ